MDFKGRRLSDILSVEVTCRSLLWLMLLSAIQSPFSTLPCLPLTCDWLVLFSYFTLSLELFSFFSHCCGHCHSRIATAEATVLFSCLCHCCWCHSTAASVSAAAPLSAPHCCHHHGPSAVSFHCHRSIPAAASVLQLVRLLTSPTAPKWQPATPETLPQLLSSLPVPLLLWLCYCSVTAAISSCALLPLYLQPVSLHHHGHPWLLHDTSSACSANDVSPK